MFFWIGIFIISIVVLVRAADFFIDGAERLGIYFNIEPFVIGVFVLGFGTSLPELVVSIISMLQGSPEVVVGNVVGSNITNVFLILGIAAIIVKKSTIKYNFLEFDLPVFMASAFFFAVMVWDGVFELAEGVFFILIFLVYMLYTITNHKKQKKLIPEEVKKAKEAAKEKLGWDAIIKLIISPFFIYLGAKFTVDAVIELSSALQIGSEIIAASAIALGTSLPELTVSFATLKKGKIGEMLGNIIGSNIFNTFIVMGVSVMIGKIIIPASILSFALPVMLFATITTFIVVYDKKITRGAGIVLLMFYVLYIAKLFDLF